jgi:hypothetical protein
LSGISPHPGHRAVKSQRFLDKSLHVRQLRPLRIPESPAAINSWDFLKIIILSKFLRRCWIPPKSVDYFLSQTFLDFWKFRQAKQSPAQTGDGRLSTSDKQIGNEPQKLRFYEF